MRKVALSLALLLFPLATSPSASAANPFCVVEGATLTPAIGHDVCDGACRTGHSVLYVVGIQSLLGGMGMTGWCDGNAEASCFGILACNDTSRPLYFTDEVVLQCRMDYSTGFVGLMYYWGECASLVCAECAIDPSMSPTYVLTSDLSGEPPAVGDAICLGGLCAPVLPYSVGIAVTPSHVRTVSCGDVQCRWSSPPQEIRA